MMSYDLACAPAGRRGGGGSSAVERAQGRQGWQWRKAPQIVSPYAST